MIEIVEKLSLHEQFRLIEIAHETRDSEIRKAALSVLQKCINPLIMGSPGNYEAQGTIKYRGHAD